jgi:hypothetical protein
VHPGRCRNTNIYYADFVLSVGLWLTELLHGIKSTIVGFVPALSPRSTGVFATKDLQSIP